MFNNYKKIKIIHIGTEKSWRGGENQIFNLIEGLEKKNIENYLSYPINSAFIKRANILFEENFHKNKIITLTSSSILDLRNIFKLYKFCKKNNINIIDVHSSNSHTLGLIIKFLIPKITLIIHRRVDNIPKKNIFTYLKYTSKKNNHFIAISHAIKNILVKYGVPSNKITVIHSSVDLTKQNIKNKNLAKKKYCELFNLPKDIFLFGNASALSSQKGYDVLLKAVHLLKIKNINFHCLIAGGGKQKKSLEELVLQLNIADKVTFLGFIEDVWEFLLSLDILSVPSNNEGLGTIILDGILAQCVVVASEVGGIPEIIKNYETGLLIKKGNHQQLAEKIEEIYLNQKLKEKLLYQSKEFIINNFSKEKMINATYDLLCHLQK